MNEDDQTDQRVRRRQALSALMDGEGSEADLACNAWRDDAGVRADWHAYHLIGELMRSDDVRCSPRRDSRFLGRLRERLADEPVVLAPAATPAAVTGRVAARRAWAAPAAVAAGFVAVAGVLMVTRGAVPGGVSSDRSPQVATQGAVPPAPASFGAPVTEGRLVRSAELDRYLAAHKQYNSTSALAAPGGMVRNAATAAPGR
jgi:sigma-E factor negative regulatory protein RseA